MSVSRGVLLVTAACGLAISLPSAASARAEKTWRPIQVVTKLKRADLPISVVQYYTLSSDPNKLLGRPSQCTGKANGKDRRIRSAGFDVDNGGSIETFANKDDAKRRFDYCRSRDEVTALR